MNMYLVTLTFPAADKLPKRVTPAIPVMAPTEAKARFLALQTVPERTLRTTLVFATVVGTVRPQIGQAA